MNRQILLILLFLGCVFGITAQSVDTLRIVHKFDLRRSINGVYAGLVYGYQLESWRFSPSDQPGQQSVEARYELASESRKDNTLTEKQVKTEAVSHFLRDQHGVISHVSNAALPSYRNLWLSLGSSGGKDTWVLSGQFASDFLSNGKSVVIPVLAEFRRRGPGKYAGSSVDQASFQFALRYQKGDDPNGDPAVAAVQGTHQGVISYDVQTGEPVFVSERIHQEISRADGTTIVEEGIALTFFEGVSSLGTGTLAAQWKQELGQATSDEAGPGAIRPDNPTPTIAVDDDPRGVKITLNNLQFVADQDVLIPGQDSAIDQIVTLLRRVPERSILVVGHTAAVGTVESQEQLSVQRAQSIVNLLKSKGIPPSHLLFEGRGGRDPIASNETDEGRARNRRVEIIVLDQ